MMSLARTFWLIAVCQITERANRMEGREVAREGFVLYSM